MKIIDRKKDLVKLQHGEYISLGKVSRHDDLLKSTYISCQSYFCILRETSRSVDMRTQRVSVLLLWEHDLSVLSKKASL